MRVQRRLIEIKRRLEYESILDSDSIESADPDSIRVQANKNGPQKEEKREFMFEELCGGPEV